jgi:histone H3/H4
MADTQPTESKNATIPTAVVKRIMAEAGAQRISPDAAEELGKTLVAHGKKLTEAAVAAAQHAGRTTIKREDVALATQGH